MYDGIIGQFVTWNNCFLIPQVIFIRHFIIEPSLYTFSPNKILKFFHSKIIKFMEIDFAEYQLSAELRGHEDDVSVFSFSFHFLAKIWATAQKDLTNFEIDFSISDFDLLIKF